jgi:hypothetical protein
MDNVVTAPVNGGHVDDGFAALAHLSDGFLGTGYSTSVELSFIAMGFIVVYVVVATARYFLHGTKIIESVADALGLRED